MNFFCPPRSPRASLLDLWLVWLEFNAGMNKSIPGDQEFLIAEMRKSCQKSTGLDTRFVIAQPALLNAALGPIVQEWE